MKLAIIAGIRSQYIKLASLKNAIEDWNLLGTAPKITPIYINAAQHYSKELSAVFFKELGLSFDFDLTEKTKDKPPLIVFTTIINEIHNILISEKDITWGLVFGDANATLASAIAIARSKIPLVHIEAGVRVNNINRIEEQNRRLTDHLAQVHFASTKKDVRNLAIEGIINTVYWTGDLIFDFVLRYVDGNIFSLLHYKKGTYIFASLHREENLMNDEIVINAISVLESYSRPVLFITHPKTKQRLMELNLYNKKNITFVDYLSYFDTLMAIKGCAFLFTDSGAFQREAYYLGKRCVIRQNEPFWKLLTDNMTHFTVGCSIDDIQNGLIKMEKTLLTEKYPQTEEFGNGKAGFNILKQLSEI